MSESVKETKSSKTVVILLIVLVILVIGGIIAGVMLLQNRKIDEDISAEAEETTKFVLGYEANGVVLFGEDELSKMLEEAYAHMEENMINIQYKHIIQSEDGVNFACYLGNPPTNDYDVYLNIYLDNNLDKQMLLTKLIPPGSLLEYFESEIKVEPGTHDVLLVVTQVEDDHATIHGQVQLILTALVGEENINSYSE